MKKDQLDPLDVRILGTLQKDGRMTNVQLASTVGLSPSACLERVKRRLEAQKVIMGYGAYFDVDKLGANITVYVEITLKEQRPEHFERFEKFVLQMPEVPRLPPGQRRVRLHRQVPVPRHQRLPGEHGPPAPGGSRYPALCQLHHPEAGQSCRPRRSPSTRSRARRLPKATCDGPAPRDIPVKNGASRVMILPGRDTSTTEETNDACLEKTARRAVAEEADQP